MRWNRPAALRRLAGRKRRPSWTLPLEAWIAAGRGAWSVMPRIGVVRWRNATEVVSPLKTDGLSPRFVRTLDSGRSVRGTWLEPPGADDRVLLYFHGGGYVFGSMRSHGDLIGALARAARARTFAVDYRLGPEHPAPAAGLPPLLIQAGDAEVLVDQIRAFVDRAHGAGVAVRLAVYPDMVHVWHMMRHVTPQAQRAIDEVGAFVRERTRDAQS